MRSPRIAALILGAALLFPLSTLAASCCGGGSGGSLILPKMMYTATSVDIAYETYNGFWGDDGQWREDPPSSDLNQKRLSLGFAQRINDNWQASVSIPYIWNDNVYANNSFQTSGIGDTSFTVLYEAFDDITCTWVLDTWEDYKPAMYFGASLTAPTGISPYDDVTNNFDITGRGFYRLDLKASFEKTVFPWNATLAFNYGTYFSRSINREYGVYVAPYQKNLGDRMSVSTSLGYTFFLKRGNTFTVTGAYADLQEKKATIEGLTDETSGMEKRSFSTTGAWANEDKSVVLKATYAYTPRYHDWGRNFPTTNTLSMGVSYVYD